MAKQLSHDAGRKHARHPGGKNVYDIVDLGEDPSLLEEVTTKDTASTTRDGPPQEAPQGISWKTFSLWAASIAVVIITIVFLVW